MIYDALSYPGTVASSGLLIALYSMAAHGQPRHRVNQAGAIAFVATGAWFGAGIALGVRGATFWNLIGNYIIFITAFVLGDNVRRRRERLHDLEQRAADLEHTRALETEHAVAAERTRISRELHDVVAHSISVMVVQAGAARRVIDQDPGRAAEAMAQVERTGRDALTEMRRLLGVLRSDDEDALRAPQPSLARLADLVSSDPELRVQLTIEGPPQELPATVDTSAYRIVQEALTNIRKHAGRTGAEVVVQYAPGELCLTVADRGRGASTFLAERADGHGLLGMRERAALVGGELQAGPRPGGGWQVRARLPFEAN
jgi:signal transduction histidine kinase